MFYYIKDNPKNLYFQLIPKNASRSALCSLLNYNNKNYLQENCNHLNFKIPKLIETLNKNKDLFFKDVYNKEDTVSAAILRDPYEKVVSAFLNKIVYEKHPNYFLKFYRDYGRPDFSQENNLLLYFDRFVDQLANSNSLSEYDVHVQEQTHSLFADFKDMEYDIFLNIETLYQDWETLRNTFPKLPDLPQKALNSSGAKDFIECYGKRNIKIIKKLYQKDYEFLEKNKIKVV
jgi:hypothetical protein